MRYFIKQVIEHNNVQMVIDRLNITGELFGFEKHIIFEMAVLAEKDSIYNFLMYDEEYKIEDSDYVLGHLNAAITTKNTNVALFLIDKINFDICNYNASLKLLYDLGDLNFSKFSSVFDLLFSKLTSRNRVDSMEILNLVNYFIEQNSDYVNTIFKNENFKLEFVSPSRFRYIFNYKRPEWLTYLCDASSMSETAFGHLCALSLINNGLYMEILLNYDKCYSSDIKSVLKFHLYMYSSENHKLKLGAFEVFKRIGSLNLSDQEFQTYCKFII